MGEYIGETKETGAFLDELSRLRAENARLREALEGVERMACTGHNTPHKQEAIDAILKQTRAALEAIK